MNDQLNAWLALDKARTAELLRIVDDQIAHEQRVLSILDSVKPIALIIEEPTP